MKNVTFLLVITFSVWVMLLLNGCGTTAKHTYKVTDPTTGILTESSASYTYYGKKTVGQLAFGLNPDTGMVELFINDLQSFQVELEGIINTLVGAALKAKGL